MGDGIGGLILGLLGILGGFSPIFILYFIHKAITVGRTYKSDTYRQKCLEQGLSSLKVEQEKYVLIEKEFAQKEADIRKVLEASLVDDSGAVQQKSNIDQELKKRMAVDKLLKEKAAEKYKNVASTLYMSYALIYNTFYEKRQEILDRVGDSLHSSQRKKMETYTVYIEEADERIKALRKEHKLSVSPKLYRDARAIEKGYDPEKIDTVFPHYFSGFSDEYSGLFVMRSPNGSIRWVIFFLLLGLGYYGSIF